MANIKVWLTEWSERDLKKALDFASKYENVEVFHVTEWSEYEYIIHDYLNKYIILSTLDLPLPDYVKNGKLNKICTSVSYATFNPGTPDLLEYNGDVFRLWYYTRNNKVKEMSTEKLFKTLDEFNLWSGYTFETLPANHKERINKANLDYPVIVYRYKGKNYICDGMHRTIKAHLMGQKQIKIKIATKKQLELSLFRNLDEGKLIDSCLKH